MASNSLCCTPFLSFFLYFLSFFAFVGKNLLDANPRNQPRKVRSTRKSFVVNKIEERADQRLFNTSVTARGYGVVVPMVVSSAACARGLGSVPAHFYRFFLLVVIVRKNDSSCIEKVFQGA